MDKKDVTFATMVANGRKPDCQIHAAGFDEGDGISAVAQLGGTAQTITNMVASIVKEAGKSVRESGGVFSGAIFAHEVGIALVDGIGEDSMNLAQAIIDGIIAMHGGDDE